MFKKQKIKSKSGITLVVLVISIVALLILAGIGISLLINSEGIIKRAKKDKEQYGQASENEKKINGVPIPNGYYYVGGTKDTGLVISDARSDENKYKKAKDGKVLNDNLVGNQWVWVPVENISKYCESVDEGVAISSSTVTTKKYTKSSIEIGTGNNKTAIARGLPNSIRYREPALLDTGYDSDDNAKKAGFENANDMATKMVREYETMIKSIEKYGGFYIGRYELSGDLNNPTEKTGETITEEDWYDLYNACKKLGANSDGTDKEGIATRMIWGCQWDATCDFIATKGERKDIINSRAWGNYSNSTFPTNTGNYKKGEKKDTGSNEAWKANNIYDIAGNCWEWTQEADNTSNRIFRGGSYSSNGSNNPLSYRDGLDPTAGFFDFLRFSSHFNNYYWNLERENQWKEGRNRLTENRTKRRRKPILYR